MKEKNVYLSEEEAGYIISSIRDDFKKLNKRGKHMTINLAFKIKDISPFIFESKDQLREWLERENPFKKLFERLCKED